MEIKIEEIGPDEIERARASEAASEAERERLVVALGQLELARIGTIHGFCSDLLHEVFG